MLGLLIEISKEKGLPQKGQPFFVWVIFISVIGAIGVIGVIGVIGIIGNVL